MLPAADRSGSAGRAWRPGRGQARRARPRASPAPWVEAPQLHLLLLLVLVLLPPSLQLPPLAVMPPGVEREPSAPRASPLLWAGALQRRWQLCQHDGEALLHPQVPQWAPAGVPRQWQTLQRHWGGGSPSFATPCLPSLALLLVGLQLWQQWQRPGRRLGRSERPTCSGPLATPTPPRAPAPPVASEPPPPLLRLEGLGPVRNWQSLPSRLALVPSAMLALQLLVAPGSEVKEAPG
mmetsp:Transcript_46545/g.118140  ORF Transcript_46545/g.118140 Transcript_46545/m.118140 type:complete len:236 (-) Transcript_46545:61-768(-)